MANRTFTNASGMSFMLGGGPLPVSWTAPHPSAGPRSNPMAATPQRSVSGGARSFNARGAAPGRQSYSVGGGVGMGGDVGPLALQGLRAARMGQGRRPGLTGKQRVQGRV